MIDLRTLYTVVKLKFLGSSFLVTSSWHPRENDSVGRVPARMSRVNWSSGNSAAQKPYVAPQRHQFAKGKGIGV